MVFEVCRNHGAYLFYSIFFALLLIIPFFHRKLSIVQYILLYLAFALLISSTSLIQIDLSFNIFLVLLHIEIIKEIPNKSIYSIIAFIIEIYAVYEHCQPFCLHYFLIIFFNFISCLIIHRILDSQFIESPFTLISSNFIAFLNPFNGYEVNSIILILSLILTIPHFPLSVLFHPIGFENLKVLIYVLLSLSLNVITIKFGLQFNALSLISDAMMSMCDCIAMIGEILADVSSNFPADKKFLFGYKRAKIICDFSISILLLYITFDLLNASIQTLLSIPDEFASQIMPNPPKANYLESTVVSSLFSFIPPNNMNVFLDSTSNITIDMSVEPITDIRESKKILLYLSLIGLCVNTFGAFFLGTIQITTCAIDQGGNAMSLISDLLSSVSVVISSFMSVFFGIEFFDPIVSILISIMIFILSIAQMRDLIRILIQSVPEKFDRRLFLLQVDDDLTMDELTDINAWSLTEETKVVTFRLQHQKEDVIGRIRSKINQFRKNNKKTLITCEVATKL